MAKFTLAARTALVATLVSGLYACGEKEKAPPPPPPAPPLTVGGSVSGLAGGEVVLQLNGADDLTVKADGKFKFNKPLKKGSTYAVTVKSSPVLPLKQTCTVESDAGSVTTIPVNNVAVTCTTDSFAIGGTVSGLRAKKKLILQLNGDKDVEITKNGDFVFPDVRLPDGGDFKVTLEQAPKGQKCSMEAINVAPDENTLNIVSVDCGKKKSTKKTSK